MQWHCHVFELQHNVTSHDFRKRIKQCRHCVGKRWIEVFLTFESMVINIYIYIYIYIYRGADKSLARPTSRCILFDGENISSNVSLIYI